MRAPFVQTSRRSAKEGRPDTADGSRRGSGAIRAVCRAWRGAQRFFKAGMDKTISRGFFLKRYFAVRCPPFFEKLVFFAHS